MKNFYKIIKAIIILIFCISLQLNAQIYNSTCSAPDSIKNVYQFDTDVIALDISRNSNYYVDSIIIPKLLKDSIMRALIAVYNAENIPNKEFINNYHINKNGYSIKNMNAFSIVTDTSIYWMKNLYNGGTVSNNSTIDSLITVFGFKVSSINKYKDEFTLDLLSESNCNIQAAQNFIANVEGIKQIVNPPSNLGYVQWNDYITYKSYADSIILDYVTIDNVLSNHRHRIFKIYNNCSVEILEFYLTSIDNNSYNSKPFYYPNPCNTILTINTSGNSIITIYDVNNSIVYQNETDTSIEINTSNFRKGIYIVEVLNGKNKTTKKIIKI